MFRKSFFSAVILCAGSSARMGGISKQMLELCGIPVSIRSISAFDNCDYCNEIVIVAKEDEIDLYPPLLEKYGIKKVTGIVKGGSSRQASAMCGSNAISARSDYIAIHDAARCLITTEDIERVFNEALKYNAATACCKSIDTIKLIGKDGKTATTDQPERAKLYCMQTPQIFRTDLYSAAAYTAVQDGFTATDDCSLLEHVGFGSRLVETEGPNMKITTPQDMIIAEALIKEREKKQ